MKTTNKSTSHHEEAYALQVKLLSDVKALTSTLRDNENPFLDNTYDLATLGTRDVVEQAVTQSLITCYDKGKELHSKYVIDRIEKAEVPFSNIIHKQNVLTFKNKPDVQNEK